MSTPELKKTAFDAAQRDLTDEWTDWEGWAWAADFGDAAAEHRATREASNVWDESALRKWDIRGPGAIALSDAAFTNDMAALELGQVRYGAICDEAGKMVMDGTIFKLADDHCFSVTSYDSDLDWLRKVASDRGLDVTIEDITAATPHLQVQGPKSREILAPITEGTDLEQLRYFRFVCPGASRSAACPAWSRAPATRASWGTSSTAAPTDATALWNAVLEAGRPHGMLPIGLSAIETLRIESGLLFPDIDYFPGQTDPFEVRLDNVVKLDKPGDFVGKDALKRIAAEGTPRLLTTLRIEGDEVPEYGAAVTVDGRDVGIVRSPCQSPTFDMQVIAMAAIERDLNVEGQELDVALGDGTVKATVGPFPLYDPGKKRPRS